MNSLMLFTNWWKIMILLFLIMSIMINLSCSMNLFTLWITMEINMLSFSSMIYSYNILSSNSMMKYFIIQSLASSLFLSMSLMSKLYFSYEMLNYMLMISMSMKLGLWPFHSWIIQISEGLNWNLLFLLNTLQKLIPMNILSLIFMNYMMMMIWITTLIFSSILLFNMLSLRKIMILSSLNHLCWMMIPIFNNNNSWIIYLTLYSWIILSITTMMKNFNISSISQFKINMINYTPLIIMFLSMMGLPPFLGFMPKIIIIFQSFNSKLMIMLIIFFSLINSWIYTRIMWNMIMNKTTINHKFNNYLNLELMNLNLTLFLITMIINF